MDGDRQICLPASEISASIVGPLGGHSRTLVHTSETSPCHPPSPPADNAPYA